MLRIDPRDNSKHFILIESSHAICKYLIIPLECPCMASNAPLLRAPLFFVVVYIVRAQTSKSHTNRLVAPWKKQDPFLSQQTVRFTFSW